MPLLDQLIRLIAPSQCMACDVDGPLLCQGCAATNLPFLVQSCFRCQKPSNSSAICPSCRSACSLHHIWSRTPYQGLAKQLIHNYKFGRGQFAAATIAAFMVQALPCVERDTLVVPIPTATSRYRVRGYDHAYLLAKALASQTGLSFCPILARLGQTRQVGASKMERHMQLRTAFRTTNGYIRASPILLVDDVSTTGASLEAAAKVLQAAGSKNINALVFARKLS